MQELNDEQAFLDRAQARLHALAAAADPALYAASAGDARAARELRELAENRREQARDTSPLLIGRLVVEDGERQHIGRCLVRDERGDVMIMSWQARAAAPFYRASRRDPLGIAHRRRYRTVGQTLSGYSDEELMPAVCVSLGLARPQVTAPAKPRVERAKVAPTASPDPVSAPDGLFPDPRPTAEPLPFQEVERAPISVPHPRTVAVPELVTPPQAVDDAEAPLQPDGVQPAESFADVDVDDQEELTEAALQLARLEALDVLGGDVLLADLDRGRDDKMRDIVATIQSDQYDLISSDGSGVLIVQGGPGTGKTAVGLHRAAYLLYNDEKVRRGNVLVVGPNQRFMEYISEVLPSLAETSVVQSTLAALLPVAGEGREDDVARDRLFGDLRMATLLRRFVVSKVQLAEKDLAVRVLGTTVRLRPADMLPVLRRALEHPGSFDEGADLLIELLTDTLADAWFATRPAGSRVDEDPRPAIAKSKAFREAVRQMWPRLNAQKALDQLLADLPGLFRFGWDLYSDAELLAIHDANIGRRADFTPAEAVLVDELAALIDGSPDSYAHVVVDEAEELTAMEARAIGRRSSRGNLTLLGDLAQASGRSGWADWAALHEALDVDSACRVELLARGFRVPAEVLDFANLLLPLLEVNVPAPVSVRAVANSLVIKPTDRQVPATAASLAQARDLARQDLSVAVVATERHAVQIHAEIGADEKIAVHTADTVRGLEYDAVVVAEPAAFLEDGPAGARSLYVALTRSTQLLMVVHAEPLPTVLMEGLPPELQAAPTGPTADSNLLTADKALALLQAALEEVRRAGASV